MQDGFLPNVTKAAVAAQLDALHNANGGGQFRGRDLSGWYLQQVGDGTRCAVGLAVCAPAGTSIVYTISVPGQITVPAGGRAVDETASAATLFSMLLRYSACSCNQQHGWHAGKL